MVKNANRSGGIIRGG
ncbi:hypothetical protein, partial [Escherichia coli]